MDVPRQGVTRRRWIRRAGLLLAALVILGSGAVGLRRLGAAAPVVQADAIWTGIVKHGDMVRDLRGTGTLVPQSIYSVSAPVEGQVFRIVQTPGARVQADTVLVELANPALEQAVTEAQWQVRQAEGELETQRANLQVELIGAKSSLAKLESENERAQMQAQVNEELYKDGLVARVEMESTKVVAREYANRLKLEAELLKVHEAAAPKRLSVYEAKVEQAKAALAQKQRQAAATKVTAGLAGVLEQVSVRTGERVQPGTSLARVSDPTHLKAVLKVPEVQAREVQPGQLVELDLRSATLHGRVRQVAPAVVEGTVAVEVGIEDELPAGARPDQSVAGNIVLEHLEGVVFVDRPMGAQPNSDGNVFLVSEDGTAVRVPVKFGRSAAATIEIVRGLKAGDRVILSDLSQWSHVDRLSVRQ